MPSATLSALKNMRRSPYQSIAAVLVLGITFFITYVFVLLMLGSERILQYFETQPQITAFFQTDTEESAVQQAEIAMRQKNYVKDVKVVTKDQALAIYQEDNKNDPLLLQLVTADILPASVEVSATDIQHLNQIESDLKSIEGIDEVVYQKDIVNSLISWTRTIRIVGIALISMLVVTSIMVVIVITGMKVAAKRHAIKIMQLVGASGWYIKSPFFFEGMYYGIFGAIIGWAGAYTLLLYLTPWLLKFLSDIPLLPIPLETLGIMLGGGVISGMLIGSISSLFSTQRFLKY